MKSVSRILIVCVILNLVMLGAVAWLGLFQPAVTDVKVPHGESAGQASPPDKLHYIPGSTSASQSQPGLVNVPSSQVNVSASPSDVTSTMQSSQQAQVQSSSGTAAAEEPLQVSVPLILIEPDPTMNLNEEQLQALERLRQQFADAVGGENQNPSDREYMRRWQEAQPEFDAQLRSILGMNAFNRLQIQAVRQEPAAPGN